MKILWLILNQHLLFPFFLIYICYKVQPEVTQLNIRVKNKREREKTLNKMFWLTDVYNSRRIRILRNKSEFKKYHAQMSPVIQRILRHTFHYDINPMLW